MRLFIRVTLAVCLFAIALRYIYYYETAPEIKRLDEIPFSKNQPVENIQQTDPGLSNSGQEYTAAARVGVILQEVTTHKTVAMVSSLVQTKWDHKEQKYVNLYTPVQDSSISNPYCQLEHLDQVNGEVGDNLIYSFSYSLRSNRVKLGTTHLNLLLVSIKKDLEKGGYSTGINATFTFDKKSMRCFGASSEFLTAPHRPGEKDIPYEQVASLEPPVKIYTKDDLRAVAFVSVNWKNPACAVFNNWCGTGDILEIK